MAGTDYWRRYRVASGSWLDDGSARVFAISAPPQFVGGAEWRRRDACADRIRGGHLDRFVQTCRALGIESRFLESGTTFRRRSNAHAPIARFFESLFPIPTDVSSSSTNFTRIFGHTTANNPSIRPLTTYGIRSQCRIVAISLANDEYFSLWPETSPLFPYSSF